MTKEENIATLNEHLEHWKRLLSEKICDQSEGEKTIDALRNAIKALEQEPFINKPCVSEKVCEHDKQIVLDKIRADIEKHCNITVGSDNEPAMTLHDIFGILDKHISRKDKG